METIMFMLGVLSGFGISWGIWKFLRQWKQENLCKTYQVKSYSTQANADGTFDIYFFLSPNTVYCGYTKKLPPEGTLPSDLEVSIRTYSTKRNKCRVFWRIKTQQ